VEGNRWPATVWDATQTHQVTTTAVMTPCSSVSLTLRVEIPDTALTGQTDALTLHVTSTARPAVGQALVVSVTAAMPWRLLPPLPTPRYRLAAAGVGNCQFFVIGGWGADDQASQANEMYDLRTGLWQAMAPKPTAAANIAAATIGGKIYVPGGMRGENRLSVLEIYDPDIDHWTRGTDLPGALTGMAVAAANGKLYVFGGSVAGGECLDNTLEYDPSTQVWSEKAPLPSGPRTYAVAAELNGKIYVAGGWSALRTFECYDPATDSWTLLAAMSTGRQALGLVAVDGYVYAVGGGDGWTGLSAVERYDPETNSWIAMPSLASSLRAGTAAVSAAGRIFVIGGADTIGGIGAAHEALAVGTSLYSSGMSVGRTMAAAGDTLTYAITLRNPGQPPINEATLRDYVPTHTVYVLDSLVGDARYNASANCIEWQGSMPPTCSKAFSFQVTIAEGVTRGTVISNTALVDDGLCGEWAILVTTTVEAVDLSPCQKLVDKPLAGSGDGLSYLIELRNTGGITATNASLIDPLPAYLTYVTGSVVGASYNPALDQIEWSGVLLPSAGGNYRWMDSDGGGVEYDWVDATISGTRVPGGGDDRSLGPFEIGFPFKFYDAEYTQFYLNTNGQVLFGAGSAVYSNVGIPNPRAPNGFIAPFWDDLVSDPGTMYYELLGSAPHRQLVIEWTDVRHFGGGGPLTFEVILYEGSDEILIQYHTLNGSYADGESATVGIENGEGTEGIQYQYNGSGLGYPLHAGLAVLFQPVGGHQIAFRAAVADNVPFNTIITNTAVVSDGFQAQRELTATTIVNSVDVSSSFKQVSAPLAVSGDLLTYRLVLACTGQLATVTASLVDYVPPNTAYVLDTVTGGAIYNGSENRIEWMGVLTCIPELPAPTPARRPYPGPVTSDAASRTMPARPLSTADQGHEITFQVHAAPDLPLNTMIGNDALLTINEQLQIPLTATTWVNRVDLSDSSLVVDKAEARAGERLVYSILLTNSGNVTVPNASLMDPIPARASYVDDSVTGGAIYNDLENRIEWSGAVPPQDSVPISFTVATSPGALHNTLVTNTVRFDDGLANVVTKTVVTVLQGHDLSASEKGMPVMALPGDVLTCTIRLRNTGLVSTSASLTDVVPLEASLIPDSLWWSSGAGSADSGTVTWHGEIIAQGMVIVRFEMRIGGDVEPGAVLSNTALIEDHTGNIYERSASTTVYSYIVNLPIIMRSGAH